MRIRDFVKPLWRAVVASGGSKSSISEALGFVKPLWRIVVASGGSKSTEMEDLELLKPLWQAVVASGRSKLGVAQGQRDLYQTENSQEVVRSLHSNEMMCSASVNFSGTCELVFCACVAPVGKSPLNFYTGAAPVGVAWV